MQTEGLLKQSQQLATELQTQQRELQQTNEQLEQKAQQLAERNVEVERKNQEIEQARRALEEKATELALTSKYKSEFLANMSHELRTPLNSILILGQQLGDNPDGNLTPKQVEFARTIHGAGTDLLNLISDILDLSKIESGTVSVDAEEIFFANLLDMVARPFRHEAETPQAVLRRPARSQSRAQHHHRLQAPAAGAEEPAVERVQVHRAGRRAAERQRGDAAAGAPRHPVLSQAPSVVAFEVTDTGIGIPPEKQKIIFEAFQQADAAPAANTAAPASASRSAASWRTCSAARSSCAARPAPAAPSRSICRSTMSGSTTAPRPGARRSVAVGAGRGAPSARSSRFADDRLEIQPGDAILLIVEDDPHYARILIDLAHDKGFKVLVATRGADALALAKQYQPTAVSLDVFLPDMLGWTVLSQLKQNPSTRHIPVQIVTLDEDRQHGLARGAFSFVTKPTTREGVSDALGQDQGLLAAAAPAAAGGRGQRGRAAEHPRTARPRRHRDRHRRHRAEKRSTSCASRPAIASCSICACPTCPASRCWNRCATNTTLADVPVVVFTGRELSPDEDAQLHTMARSVVVKGVESPERLLDETALFLHRVFADLPPEKQRMLERLNSSDEDLVGRTVLLVDDDARNIFALSSVLERRGMHVLTATTGSEAIASARGDAGTRDRADGHHDAGNGRLSDDRDDPPQSGLPPPADHRADRQGDEGRPREMPRGRRLGLSGQAGQHRAAAVRAAHVAASLGAAA